MDAGFGLAVDDGAAHQGLAVRPAAPRDRRPRRRRRPAGRPAAALLCFLLAARERAADRDELVDLLWAERPPRDPGAALRPLLSRLRRALAPATLEGRERLRLSLPEPVWVDVEAAAQATAEARPPRRPAAGPTRASGRRRCWSCSAPGCCRGRTATGSRRAGGSSASSSSRRSRRGPQRPGARRDRVRRGRAREPRADRPLAVPRAGHRLLMEALAGAGNVAEALRVYDALPCSYATSSGPRRPRTCRRCTCGCSRARAPNPRPRARPPPRASSPRRSRSPPAAVRQPHRRARDAARAAPPGRAAGRRAVLIAGEARSGKSRLVREFAAEAAAAARWSSTAAATRWSARPTGRSSRPSTTSRGSPAPRRCALRSARRTGSSCACSPTSRPGPARPPPRSRRTRTRSASGCTPRSPTCWPRSAGQRRCCSSSRTPTRPTPPRSISCGTSCAPAAARGCCSS